MFHALVAVVMIELALWMS